MALLEIRVLPDPILRQKAKRVRAVDSSIRKLIDDMLETLHASPNRVGLAAPQVGISLRVAVIGLPDEEDIVLVNPEVLRRTGERVVNEGCLSLPGYSADIKRSEAVTVKARDRAGKEVRIRGKELLGQALEHEIDHLNGILYIDYLESLDQLQKVEPPGAQEEVETPETA